MTSLRSHLTYANVVATLALVVAVAGGSTAIAVSSKVKKNSVGTKQLKNGSVTAAKLANGNVTAPKLAPVRIVSAQGTGAPATDAIAQCSGNDRLLGGGAQAAPGGSLSASKSSPLSAPGWDAATTPIGPSATAQALCLSATPGS
jgi:hypothetical protein